MAENKKGFVLYADYITTIRKLPVEKIGELFLTILSYVNDESPVVSDVMVDLVFEPIKLQLKRDLKKYEKFRQRQSDNGKKGGRPPNKENPNNPSLISETQKSLTVTVTDTVNVTDTVIDKNIYIEKPSNFFYIGTEIYKFPVSSYVKTELQIHINSFLPTVKPITLENILNEMDISYCGYQFNNHNHILKSFDMVARGLQKSLTLNNYNSNKQTENIKATTNYGNPKQKE